MTSRFGARLRSAAAGSFPAALESSALRSYPYMAGRGKLALHFPAAALAAGDLFVQAYYSFE